MFCPNVNTQEWKDLVAMQGKTNAYALWNLYKGVVPNKYFTAPLEVDPEERRKARVYEAKTWLESRFPGKSVQFFDAAQKIGDEEVHGYVENAAVHLWSAAEIGTEYHEAYHLVFRTMLSNEERDQLYTEASKLGTPTAEELTKVRKAFPNITDAEASNLVLEERMAEQFREYVLSEQASEKSLPKKIAKWFKDLWNWIKAMFSDKRSLRQVYSLIESGRMNKSFISKGVFRNPEQFVGTDKAFMYRQDYKEKEFQEAAMSVFTYFMDTKKYLERTGNETEIAAKLLGNSTTKGLIAEGALSRIYKSTDGRELTSEELVELFNAENAYITTRSKEDGAKVLEAFTRLKATAALGEHQTRRAVFFDFYKNWNSTIEPKTGNVITYGWREILKWKLKSEAGIKIVDSKGKLTSVDYTSLSEEEQEELDTIMDSTDEALVKIYGKSALEDSPAKRLTGKVKQLLSTIKSTAPNFIGDYTYMDKDFVYKSLLNIFSEKASFAQMLAALENTVRHRPELQPVLDFMNKLSSPEQAMIYNAFALATTEFLFMRSRETNGKSYVDVFNPNRTSIEERTINKWRQDLIAATDVSSTSLYTERTLDDKTQTLSLSIRKEKLTQIIEKFRELEKRVLNVDTRAGKPAVKGDQVHEYSKLIGDIMWDLGLYIGDNILPNDTYLSIQKIVNAGYVQYDAKNNRRVYDGFDAIVQLGLMMVPIIKSIGKFEGESRFSRLGELKNVAAGGQDYVTSKRGHMLELASIFSPVMAITGQSFVNVEGKQINPTNLQSHMLEIAVGIKRRDEELLNIYRTDPFFSALGIPKYQSIMLRHMLQSPEFMDNFGVRDFDGFRDGEMPDDATTYEDMNALDSYIIRLNGFINNGFREGISYIAVPIQSDRSKYSFIATPNVLGNAFKLQDTRQDDLVIAQIVQDMLRIAEAKRTVREAIKTNDYSNLLHNYHYSGSVIDFQNTSKEEIVNRLIKDSVFTGNAFKNDFLQFTAKDKNGAQIVTDVELTKDSMGGKRLSDVIEDYAKGKLDKKSAEMIDAMLKNMAAGMNEYFEQKATEILELLKRNPEDQNLSRVSFASVPNLKQEELVKAFVVQETIMRNEIVKLFRGNRALSKNLVDFYKRMGHLTTPGSKYAIQGELADSTDPYGMMPTFTEATFKDVKLDYNIAQKERVNRAAEDMRLGLIASGVPAEKAKTISDKYKASEFESTDAMSYINLTMYRGLMMGEGNWDMKIHEPAYQAYMKGETDEFVYQEGAAPAGNKAGDAIPLYPIKTYYEKLQLVKNTAAVVSEKNSYSVLIRSYTKNYPAMNDFLSRMEATGVYAGLQPINVTNFVSGKKLAKKNVATIPGELGKLDTLQLNINSARGLRKPQSIPEMKGSPKVTLNRQIKKNMVSNVQDGTVYEYNPGLGFSTQISGADLKRLYHAAIEAKIDKDIKGVEKRLKLDYLEQLKKEGSVYTAEDLKKAQNEILKTIRQILEQNIYDSDLSAGYLQALNFEVDETGKLRFAMPLDLPVYAKKYESIIMAILQNEVFKQNVKGFEAVQVAQIGGHATSNELQFYRVDVKGKRLLHAEVEIREDVARKFGIQPGQNLDEVPEELRRIIGYRIPNQDKASSVALVVKRILPANYAKAIVVPGQLIKLMGSDFDVDKLFLMFPEVETDENDNLKKVVPNYPALINGQLKVSSLSTAELNNVILDTMEAVLVNQAHFVEALSPLDDVTLRSEVERVRKAIPEFNTALDWNDPATETNIMLRNQAGNKLRGVYANIIAGRNVAIHGVVNLNEDYAIKIEQPDGSTTTYKTYREHTKEGIPTDKVGSLFLSAAVDAGKEPLQLELNDNLITVPVRALFIAYHDEYGSETCTNLLNQPAVRLMVKIIEEKYGGDLRHITKAFNAAKGMIAKDTHRAEAANLDGKKSVSMKPGELENLGQDLAARNTMEQLNMLNNFYAFYRAGRQLLNLYKRITPDSMDGLNRISNIQSYADRDRQFTSLLNEDGTVKQLAMFTTNNPAENVVSQFIGENSVFGLERGYEKLMSKAMEVASYYFPMRTSPAFGMFKSRIMELAGKTELTPEMHELIDSNIVFLLMIRPDSPFYRYTNEQYAIEMYTDSKSNLGTYMATMKATYPLLKGNKFISNFEQVVDPSNSLYSVKFNSVEGMSRPEKDAYTAAITTLLFNPKLYVNMPDSMKTMTNGKFDNPEVEKATREIKRLGIALVMHNFLTNAFRKSPSSFTDLIPPEFFHIKQTLDDGSQISISEYLHNMASQMQDENFFTSEDLLTFMQMFGPMKAAGRPLLSRANSKVYSPEATTELLLSNYEPVIMVTNRKTKKWGIFIKGPSGKDGRNLYLPVQSYFTGKAIYAVPAITAEPRAERSYHVTMVQDMIQNSLKPRYIKNLPISGCK
jgi:hypothetical protein